MSRIGLDHLEEWIRENVNETIYPEEGDDTVAKGYADQYRAAAKADGVSIQEVEAEAGSIEDRMSEAIEASVDAESDRVKGKDRS